MVRYRCQKGLTLWEIIIVVGIVAILVAIIATVALNVRRQSHMVACASNLRQIALAAHMYVADYETLPAGWSFYIDPYIKDRRIFICPADKLSVPLQRLDSSYAFFSDIQGYYNSTNFYVRQVRTYNSVQLDPNLVLVLCEHHMGWRIITLRSPSGSHFVYDTAEMPPHPHLQVLRYHGAVHRVHLCRVRKLWGVHPHGLRVFHPVYPDMEDYEYATGFYYENTCNRGAL